MEERKGERENGEEFEGTEASGGTQVEGSARRKTGGGSHFLPKTSFYQIFRTSFGTMITKKARGGAGERRGAENMRRGLMMWEERKEGKEQNG